MSAGKPLSEADRLRAGAVALREVDDMLLHILAAALEDDADALDRGETGRESRITAGLALADTWVEKWRTA